MILELHEILGMSDRVAVISGFDLRGSESHKRSERILGWRLGRAK